MSVNLIEQMGIIIRTESFFEDNDHTPRIRVDFIDGKKRMAIIGSVFEFESLLSLLQVEVDKATDRKYIP